MKIGFLILRDTFLKTMGSLIIETADRGHQVILFYDPSAVAGDKAHQKVTSGKLSVFDSANVEIEEFSLANLDDLGKKHGLDVLVTHEGYHVLNKHLGRLKALRSSGTVLVSLSHFYETAKNPLEALDYFEKTYYLSCFGLDLHFKLGETHNSETELRKKYASQVEVVSSPMLDQLRGLDKEKIREEFGVPLGKKVVVLFAPVISPVTFWRFYVWKEKDRLKRIWRILKNKKWKYLAEAVATPSFEEVARAIRQFCDRSDAFLIVKSRQKQADPTFLKHTADLYLSGEHEDYFPLFASYKILAVADLSITAMSMSVVESVAAGVPVVNIYVPHMDIETLQGPGQEKRSNYLDAVMNVKQEGPFNFPGCVTVVDRNAIVGWLKNKKIEDLTPKLDRLRAYQDKYLGMEEMSSSARVLSSIETLVELKKTKVPVK